MFYFVKKKYKIFDGIALVELSRDVARASGRQLVNVDKETLVRIARIERQHAVVDVLLQT